MSEDVNEDSATIRFENLWSSVLVAAEEREHGKLRISRDDHVFTSGATATPTRGQCYSWGKSTSFQLGLKTDISMSSKNGTSSDSAKERDRPLKLSKSHAPSPTLIGALQTTPITMVAAGASHSLALDSKGLVYSWGSSSCGQLGHGDFLQRKYPEIVSYFCERDAMVTHISAGQSHSMCVTASGMLFGFGSNECAQLGLALERLDDYAYPRADRHRPITIYTLPALISKLDDKGIRVASVECGFNQTVIITSKGRAIRCGSTESSAGLKLVRGVNYSERLVIGAACSRSDTLLLTDDGAVWRYSSSRFEQVAFSFYEQEPTTLPHVVKVAAGNDHFLALDTHGRVFSWGSNSWGQLGTGARSRKRTSHPVLLDNEDLHGMSFREIACGWQYSVLISRSGECFAFGCGSHGQLGTGGLSTVPTPTMVLNMHSRNASAVACGEAHTLAVASGSSAKIDFSNLLGSDEFSDVTFHLSWKACIREFPAHCAILAARCPHLRNLLLSERSRLAAGMGSSKSHLTMGFSDALPGFPTLLISLRLPYDLFYRYLEYLYTDRVFGKDSEEVDSEILRRIKALGEQLGHDRLQHLAGVLMGEQADRLSSPSTFNEDIESLLQKRGPGRTFSDVTIEIYKELEGQSLGLDVRFDTLDLISVIHAHKCILQRVDYYRAMFEFLSDKSQRMVVRKNDVSASALKQAVTWMYGQAIELEPGTVMEVLQTALIYNFSRLIQVAVLYLEKELDPTNAISLLGVAEHFHLSHLLHFTLDYVASNFDDCLQFEEDVWEADISVETKHLVAMRRPAQVLSLAELRTKQLESCATPNYMPAYKPIRGAGSLKVVSRERHDGAEDSLSMEASGVHNGDAVLADPETSLLRASGLGTSAVSGSTSKHDDAVASLLELGFTDMVALHRALNETGGNVEAAVGVLVFHAGK